MLPWVGDEILTIGFIPRPFARWTPLPDAYPLVSAAIMTVGVVYRHTELAVSFDFRYPPGARGHISHEHTIPLSPHLLLLSSSSPFYASFSPSLHPPSFSKEKEFWMHSLLTACSLLHLTNRRPCCFKHWSSELLALACEQQGSRNSALDLLVRKRKQHFSCRHIEIYIYLLENHLWD